MWKPFQVTSDDLIERLGRHRLKRCEVGIEYDFLAPDDVDEAFHGARSEDWFSPMFVRFGHTDGFTGFRLRGQYEMFLQSPSFCACLVS